MEFVESRLFTTVARQLLNDESYRELQNELLENPKKGDVMPGCGGLRKARIVERGRGKGKRAGCRIIYLYIPEADRIDLLAIYSKGERDDLTPEQRRGLKTLAEQAHTEAIRRHQRKGRQ